MTVNWRDAVPTRKAWVLAPTLALGGLLAGIIATAWFFLTRPAGQIVDQLALLGASEYTESPSGTIRETLYETLVSLTMPVLDVAEVWFVVVAAIVIVGIAVLRRQWWLALAAMVMSLGANLTTQAIKGVGDQQTHGLYETYGNSWPSGHTTIAATVALSLLLVVPGRWRWVAALAGSIFTTLMAWATVLSGWHRPSDTVAAVLISAIWYVLVEIARRSLAPVPLTAGVRSPVAIRILDITSGICAALGVGILAATLLTLPDTPVGQMEVAIQRLAFVGAFFGVAAIVVGTIRVLLAVGPHEDHPSWQ